MPKLTVTIPSYRQPDLLSRALQGLNTQTFKDFSVIIVDDKSGVDFENIIKNYPDLNISIDTNETNLGAMKNLYRSITIETNSDYIFSHHEDDFVKNNYLEIAVSILDNNPQISFVTTSGEWVHRDDPFVNKKIESSEYEQFNAPHFVDQILNNKHFMFGSVVYRKKHLVHKWGLEKYGTFCDRIFFLDILKKNHTSGAYLIEPGIFERDHSLDKNDIRSISTNEDHVIAFYQAYKEALTEEFDKDYVSRKITNYTLFTYGNLPHKSNLFSFYKKQKPYELLHFSKINILGIYSLLTMPLSQKLKLKIIKIAKYFNKNS